MGDYYCTHVWQLKQGASLQDVEHLALLSVLGVRAWEQLCFLVEEYAGEMAMNVGIE